MFTFDDGLLDDPTALHRADALLRPLAEAGARLRRDAVGAESALVSLDPDDRPRAVIAVGPEARLLRAVLEPVCPVPFVAWPHVGLPAWVGPLDIVVVLGGADHRSALSVHEAQRRGSRMIVVAPTDAPLVHYADARATTVVPTTEADPLSGAIIALRALQGLGIAPHISIEAIAAAMDAVAVECSYAHDISHNPAKALALELADTQPLLWGGSVLAARAARRVAEAFRTASGRIALAADAAALTPMIISLPPRDPFADPFEDQVEDRPVLVVLDDDLGDDAEAETRSILENNAAAADMRVCHITVAQGSAVERYVTMLQRGLFAMAYLQVGLARS